MSMPQPTLRALPRRRLLQLAAAAGAATLGLPRAFAQADDKSTVTVLVGAASTMDATARLTSDFLREALGRPVITVSKLGAGGRLALGELRKAAPDGRTLMVIGLEGSHKSSPIRCSQGISSSTGARGSHNGCNENRASDRLHATAIVRSPSSSRLLRHRSGCSPVQADGWPGGLTAALSIRASTGRSQRRGPQS